MTHCNDCINHGFKFEILDLIIIFISYISTNISFITKLLPDKCSAARNNYAYMALWLVSQSISISQVPALGTQLGQLQPDTVIIHWMGKGAEIQHINGQSQCTVEYIKMHVMIIYLSTIKYLYAFHV